MLSWKAVEALSKIWKQSTEHKKRTLSSANATIWIFN